MLQLDNNNPQVLDINNYATKKEFINRMQRKLEVKEALHRVTKRHHILDRLAWLSFDSDKKHLLL